jgi:hypothetical protein
MTSKDLLAALRKHTGPIYLDVNNSNDCFWLQGVKSDLIEQMSSKFPDPAQETGFEIDAEGYFSKDYSA